MEKHAIQYLNNRGIKMRINREEYYIRLAEITSKRSTCNRAKVGAVAVKDKRIIATGYNGSPAGWAHCDTAGHLLSGNHCIRTVHAEMNIICQCAKFGISLEKAIVYTTHSPCYQCLKHLENVGVKEVHFLFSKKDLDMPKNISFMKIKVIQIQV